MDQTQTDIQCHSASQATTIQLMSYDGKTVANMKLNWENNTHTLITVSRNEDYKAVVLLKRGTSSLRWNLLAANEVNILQILKLQELATDTFKVKRKMILQVENTTMTVEKDCKKLTEFFGNKTDFDIQQQTVDPRVVKLRKKSKEDTFNMVTIYDLKTRQEYLILAGSNKANLCDLPSRADYEVRCISFQIEKDSSRNFRRLVHPSQQMISKVLSVKIPMDQKILHKLLTKAEDFCQRNQRCPGTYEIQAFYRNKPLLYFHKILSEKNGIMAKYIKDNNGDPYSAINRRINGLFFSASLETRTMSPPYFSYFGDTRFFIPASKLLTPNTRIYFADFYCNYTTHYVTLVLTKRNSVEDAFCQQWLIELDMENNPFFTVQNKYLMANLCSRFDSSVSIRQSRHFLPLSAISHPPARMETYVMISVNNFHIEFLYTENVNIKGRHLEPVQGRGVSRPDGIPKNSNCPQCNLD